MLLKPIETLEFEGNALEAYDLNGERWIRSSQIVTTLSITDSTIRQMVKRNKTEFGPLETQIVTVQTTGGVQQGRVFSPRGAMLVAMLSQSPKAADFRQWVLDVLEARTLPPQVHQQIDALQAALLKADPFLAKIARYRQLGLNRTEIGKLMDRKTNAVRRALRSLEACGIVEPPENLSRLQGDMQVGNRARMLEGRKHG